MTALPDETSAMLAARLQDHRVEIQNWESATSTSWANPDGSITYQAAADPIRVQSGDGSLVPLDLDLAENADGSYSPGASPADVTLSGGSDKTSATLEESHNRSVGLGWPSPLPEPTIDGATATYALSDNESLVVAPTSAGFEEHIVLSSAPTGDVALKVPLRLSHLDAVETDEGGVDLQTASGDTVASTPQFLMWDATADSDSDLSQQAVVDSHLDHTAAGTPELVLTPSMDFLTAPTTQYPVTIDPGMTLTSTESNHWYTNNTVDQSGDYKMPVGTQDSGTTKYRSFVRFNLNQLIGSHVTNASMNLWQYDAGACTAKQINAFATTTTGNGKVWANQPTTTTTGQSSASFNTGDDACVPAQLNGMQSIDLTTMIDDVAQGTLDWKGLELKAGSETANGYWKKFCSSVVVDSATSPVCDTTSHVPTLTVTYNSYPGTAMNLSAAPSSIGGDGVTYVSSLTPSFHAAVADPDGTRQEVDFEVNFDPAYTDGTGLAWSGSVSQIASGKTTVVTVPSGVLHQGWHLQWRARGFDGTDYSRSWTSWQHFQINTQKPSAPTVACAGFPSGSWSNGSLPATCTFTDSTDSDLAGFFYSLDDPEPDTQISATGSSGTMNLKSGLTTGWHKLYVQSYNKANLRSSTTTQFAFGYGVGGFTSPDDGDSTQSAITLSTAATSVEAGVTYKYHLGTTGSFVNVPVNDVVIAGSTTHPTWPQAVASGASAPLVWNMAQTVANAGGSDGAVQLRACFSHSGTSDGCSTTETLELNTGVFDYASAVRNLGPGQISLLTGDFDVHENDLTLPAAADDITLGRDFTTLSPSTSDLGTTGIFGPGWVSTVPSTTGGIADETLATDPTHGVATLTTSSGLTFSYKTSDSSSPYTYTGLGSANDGTKIVETITTSPSSDTVTVTEAGGLVTSFTKVNGAFQAQTVNEPGAEHTTSYSYNSKGQVTQVVAPTPTGVSCSNPLTTRGCRSLSMTYSTSSDPNLATGTAPGTWGNYWDSANGVGRLASVDMTAWDPSTSAMTTTTLASYDYDNTGMLRGQWDPRVSGKLETTYSYNAQGRLASLKPPGQNAWQMTYGSAGTLASVQRTDPANGVATSAVAYGIPVSGSGAPVDMSAAGSWGQSDDVPYEATEIFPADHVPATNGSGDYVPTSSDYPFGEIAYMDVSGNDVNDATYGAGDWLVSARQFDGVGNDVWSLSASARAQALNPTSDTDPFVAALSSSADRASYLATASMYDSSGTDLIDEYGPMHQVVLDNGSLAGAVVDARDHVHYTYNQGAPATGGPYDEETQKDESPYFVQNGSSLPADYSPDTRTTKTSYDPIDGTSNTSPTSGWTLDTPIKTTIDMKGTSGNIGESVELDSSGRVIQTRLPIADSLGISNTAETTNFVYYAAASNATYPECGNHAEWAGLVCRTGPAGQPSSGSSVPVKEDSYDIYNQPTVVTQTSGTTTRTTTRTYDTAGRRQTFSINDNSSGVTSIPSQTFGYNSATGFMTTRTTSAGTITTGFDAVGRVTSYKALTAVGINTTTTTYDIDNRPKTIDDGKGTTTLTYGSTDSLGRTEHRGLATSKSTGVGSDAFGASYNADGQVESETYPNGLVATRSFDSLGQPTELKYKMGSTEWLDFTQVGNVFREVRQQASPESSQQERYDFAGRLTQVDDAGDQTCQTRTYGYDLDSNRSSFKAYPADSSGFCSIATTPSTSISSTHDEYDRSNNSGYTYDKLGRTLTVPAVESGDTTASPTALNLSYFADDMIHSATQDGVTDTYTLDPAERQLGMTDGATGVVSTNIYADSGDAPIWISNSDGSWLRLLTDLGGSTAGTETAADTNHTTLLLVNLHGDAVATVADSGTASAPVVGTSSYFENTEFGAARNGAAGTTQPYAWLGGTRRPTSPMPGVMLMGVRVYNPYEGRFLSVDPIEGGSANRYDYANQDPIDGRDFGGTSSGPKITGDPWLAHPRHNALSNCRGNSNWSEQGILKKHVYVNPWTHRVERDRYEPGDSQSLNGDITTKVWIDRFFSVGVKVCGCHYGDWWIAYYATHYKHAYVYFRTSCSDTSCTSNWNYGQLYDGYGPTHYDHN
ncbi:MAG: hypothetical protein JO214_12080 [Frankiaceae bacterium]|nr:hypothetical protein [Frankiaceae bacterium]